MALRVRHVFFDLTDTLFRVRGSVGEIYSRLAARHGLDAPAPAIDRTFAPAIAGIPQPVAPGLPEPEIRRREFEWWRSVTRRTLEPFGEFPRFEAFFAEVFELFRTREAWEPVSGVPEVLHTLRAAGRGLGIISDMDSRLFDVLADFGLADLFDPVCLSFRAGYKKPERRLFETALEQARVSGHAAAHVGDNLTTDVQGALDAGLIAVHFDAHQRRGTPRAAHAIGALAELPALLDRLEAGAH